MTIKDDNEEEKAEEQDDVELTERRFPKAFYDPITHTVMRDPVVNPNGDSYDQSTIDNMSNEDDNNVSYYPNRALKSAIERYTDLESNSIRGSVRRLDEKLKDGWGRLVEKSAFGFEHRPLPPSLYCPITCELMTDPVVTPEGYSYEYDAIVHWINANGVSPMTRSALSVDDLRDNNALYELLQEEKNRTDESLHPSIRRWKEAGPTSRRRVKGEHPAPSAPPGTAADAQDATDNPATTTTTAAGSQNYPTTQAEIRRRQYRQARMGRLTLVAIVLAVLVVLGVIPYAFIGVIFFMFIFICACSAVSSRDDE